MIWDDVVDFTIERWDLEESVDLLDFTTYPELLASIFENNEFLPPSNDIVNDPSVQINSSLPDCDFQSHNESRTTWHDDEFSLSSTETGLELAPKVAVHSLAKLDRKKDKRQRVRKSYDPPLGERMYYELTNRDVGMGRGGAMNRHPGNIRFHQAKVLLQNLYLSTRQADRTVVAQQLVDEVKQWGGRFLKQDSNGWYEVHNHTARTKCSQALREDFTAEERAAKRQRYRRSKRE